MIQLIGNLTVDATSAAEGGATVSTGSAMNVPLGPGLEEQSNDAKWCPDTPILSPFREGCILASKDRCKKGANRDIRILQVDWRCYIANKGHKRFHTNLTNNGSRMNENEMIKYVKPTYNFHNCCSIHMFHGPRHDPHLKIHLVLYLFPSWPALCFIQVSLKSGNLLTLGLASDYWLDPKHRVWPAWPHVIKTLARLRWLKAFWGPWIWSHLILHFLIKDGSHISFAQSSQIMTGRTKGQNYVWSTYICIGIKNKTNLFRNCSQIFHNDGTYYTCKWY